MRAVTLQASDDRGGTYVFHLTPKDIPGEVILSKPRETATNKHRTGKRMVLSAGDQKHDARVKQIRSSGGAPS